MEPDKVASLLHHDKKIGFRVIAIEAWGRPLTRPDDTSLELIDVRARGDLLVLTLSPNNDADKRVGAMELAIEKPDQPKLSKDAIEFAKVAFLRFDELSLRLKGGKVSGSRRGHAEPDFDAAAGAPALVLRRDPFV